ncbi:hypothetical protein LCGC14_1949580 [marine sediment metagenome]|uniref:Uncharacterized protein n=1 Tax=marine sediment metagenome TaxID=412755 RepID=A0A0F9HW82_9ZZZZ
MERLSFSETDTFGEVNKALNMLIDAYNELIKPPQKKSKKKSKKKGGK